MTVPIYNHYSLDTIIGYLKYIPFHYSSDQTDEFNDDCHYLTSLIHRFNHVRAEGRPAIAIMLKELLDGNRRLLNLVTTYVHNVQRLMYMLIIDPIYFNDEIMRLNNDGVIIDMGYGLGWGTNFTSDHILSSGHYNRELGFSFGGPGYLLVYNEIIERQLNDQ